MGCRRIYHLMPASRWNEEAAGEGPVASDQHARHGFVHCCTREQIVEIASWWFKDEAPLVALEIDADAVPNLRFERPEGEAREFPHVYAPLHRDLIVATHDVPYDEGVFALPPAIASPPPMFEMIGRRRGRAVSVRWQHGELSADDPTIVEAARELVAKQAPIERYLHVTGTASLDTAYEAYAVLATLFDEISVYRGDGFA